VQVAVDVSTETGRRVLCPTQSRLAITPTVANPLDFTEQYFPTKLVTDIYQAGSPQISRQVAHPDGIAANPTINLLGGEGLVVGNGATPSGVTVVAPGYHHLDVLTAAPIQNSGQPEVVSTSLAAFATP
jgi:hypothetical protein